MTQEALRELCVRMKDIQFEKERLEEALSEVNKQLDVLRLREIPQLMEALEIRTCTFSGLGRVQLAADVYASTKEGKKEAAFLWLRDTGYEGMITETVNASTLKALFRRMLADGVPIPDEIFSVTPFVRASIVKA